MRVFTIGSDDSFSEYEPEPFQAEHEEAVLQKWLKANPDGVLEDGPLFIIGQEVHTDLGGFVDLLALDRHGNVVVVELKRARTPRDTIAQALEYAAYASRLDAVALERILQTSEGDESLSLADLHRTYFELDEAAAISFNKDQRVVIIGQKVTPQIRQTASFLGSKGLLVTCVEFSFFRGDGGRRLLSQEIVVTEERPQPGLITGSRTKVTEAGFLESCDAHGRAVFSRILDWANRNSMSIRWGRGFSVGVDLDGVRVVVCYAYPPYSGSEQSLYTALRDRFGLPRTAAPESVIATLRQRAEATGLFIEAGRDLKCLINRALADAELDKLMDWLESVRQAMVVYGPEASTESSDGATAGQE